MLSTQQAIHRLQEEIDAPPSTHKKGPDWLLGPEKRQWDLRICKAALPLLLRVVPTSGAAIYMWDWGSPIFRQERVGQYGIPFRIYKLRTMKGGVVTRPGKCLREKTRDESPNWLNVLRGEMSWTGSRPLIGKEIAHDVESYEQEGVLSMEKVLGPVRYQKWLGVYLPFRPGLASTFCSRDFEPNTPEYCEARADANLEHAETASPEGDRELLTQMFNRMCA